MTTSPLKEIQEKRTQTTTICLFHCFISRMEPKNVIEALQDAEWITSMQAELSEFKRNKVWRLIPKPANASVIGLKWIFINKVDKDGNVIRNKSRWWSKAVVNMKELTMKRHFLQ